MQLHPLADLPPPMSEEQYDQLRDDIKQHGLRVPIVLFRGAVLDGRHRLKACAEIGIEPIFSTFDGTEADAVFEVGSLNAARRNLNKAQLTMFGLRLKAQHAVLAKQRQLEALQAGNRTKHGKSSVVAHVPEPSEGRARDLAAKAVGVGGRNIDKAEAMAKAAVPEVVAKVESGNMSINEALTISSLPKARQREVVELPKRQRTAAVSKSLAKSRGRGGGDKRHLRQADDAPGTQHVRFVLSRLELVTNEIQRAGLTAQQYAGRFVEEFDWSDPALTTRLSYVSPAIEAIASLAVIGQRARREAA